ncbi:glycosyltransferase [Streptococcus cristatus]|jgi:putative glycosyltransferase|uniref:glycosyltransferase family 2 protein n=1 Tax=Streptococcus cristatus TaxID=45634 RepID=UPI0039C1090F
MIAFVILHYQALDETIDCVCTIKKMVKGPKYIVIVDNASPNKTGEELIEKYQTDEEVTVLVSKENIGFARGNNLGYVEAKRHSPEYIVVMNNDVFITQPDFTERLNKLQAIHQFDVLGPDIFSTKTNIHQNPQRERNYSLQELKTAQKKLQFKDKFKFLIRLKYLLRNRPDENVSQVAGFDSVQINKPLHGAIYIFAKSFIDTHDECFYSKTFMYYESYILHYLGMRDNLKFVYDPSIKVVHHEDVSTNQTYKDLYRKVIFVNKCLLESCNAFIELMESTED